MIAALTPDTPPVRCSGPINAKSAISLAPSETRATSANLTNCVPALVRSRFAAAAGSLSMSFGIDVLGTRRHAGDGDTYTVREPVEAVTRTAHKAAVRSARRRRPHPGTG